jgi:hypothetical protein
MQEKLLFFVLRSMSVYNCVQDWTITESQFFFSSRYSIAILTLSSLTPNSGLSFFLQEGSLRAYPLHRLNAITV